MAQELLPHARDTGALRDQMTGSLNQAAMNGPPPRVMPLSSCSIPSYRSNWNAGRSVLDVTPALLPRPTPCQGWNLGMLLRHASESLAALHDGTVTGHVALASATPDCDPAADPVRAFCDRAVQLLAARATAGPRHQVLGIGDLPLPAIAMECAGAIEIAVHGWDVSQACGHNRPIPDALAASLLAIAPLIIPETGRHPCSARRSP